MIRRAPVLLSLVSLAAMLAAGCSLGPREDWAEAIQNAYDAAQDAGNAKVAMSVAVNPIETAIEEKPQPLIAKAAGVVDFRTNASAMVATAGRKGSVRYDDLVGFLPRSRAAVSDSEDGKTIVAMDFEREASEDIDDNDRRVAVGAGALISPALAVEVLDGVLTGSIEKVGEGVKAGVQTTHYTARLAPDSAVRDITDEDRRAGVLRVFESLGVRQDLFPIEVWIDADGLVRGLLFDMRQQKDRVNAYRLRTSWEFTDYGTTQAPDIPAADSAHEARRIKDFIVEFIREG